MSKFPPEGFFSNNRPIWRRAVGTFVFSHYNYTLEKKRLIGKEVDKTMATTVIPARSPPLIILANKKDSDYRPLNQVTIADLTTVPTCTDFSTPG